MSQIIEITATEGLISPGAKAYADGSDTLAGTASSVVAAENRNGLYLATFTGLSVGVYRVELSDAGGLAAVRNVNVTATTGTFTEKDVTVEADTTAIAKAVIDGLGSVSITRIGPEYEPATKTVTLYSGDDYLAANSNALTFAITLPGVSLIGASAVFSADSKYASILRGTATLIDTETDTPKLRLEWTRAQTLAIEPSDKLCWGVAIVDSGNRVQTIIGGPLKLKRALVNPTVTQAAIDS
jgi:hypothetical protein